MTTDTATKVRVILLAHAAKAGYEDDWVPDDLPLQAGGLGLDDPGVWEALTEVEEASGVLLDQHGLATIGDVIRAVEKRTCCTA